MSRGGLDPLVERATGLPVSVQCVSASGSIGVCARWPASAARSPPPARGCAQTAEALSVTVQERGLSCRSQCNSDSAQACPLLRCVLCVTRTAKRLTRHPVSLKLHIDRIHKPMAKRTKNPPSRVPRWVHVTWLIYRCSFGVGCFLFKIYAFIRPLAPVAPLLQSMGSRHVGSVAAVRGLSCSVAC